MSEYGRHRERPLILLVDDDVTVRFLLGNVLKEAGFDVVDGEDGAQGVARAKEVAPDLVILDVVMPLLNGYEACAAIRSLPEGADTPVLMLTGLDDVHSFRRAFEAGATDFATKPISPAMLSHRVHFMLRASAALAALRESEARLAEAQRIARLGHWEVDLVAGTFVGSSQVIALLGLPLGVGTTFEDYMACVHPEDSADLRRAFDAVTHDDRPLDHRHRLIGEGGNSRFVHVRGELMRDGSGMPQCVRGTLQDITAEVRTEERVQRLAYQDGLTGLPNRLLFTERLKSALSHAMRRRRKVATMLLDLNDFKQINNSLGHGAGDAVLAEVARRLREVVRRHDEVSRASASEVPSTVARWGGDEFLFAVVDLASGEDASAVASRVIEVLQAPIHHGGRELYVSASIGISLFPDDATEPADLLQHADIALHQAKEVGRNTFAFFDTSMNERTMVRLVLESGLRQALGTEEMSVHYQPLVDGRDGRILGFEALMRWFHPQMGPVSPEQFVPIAERLGLIGELTAHLMREVCARIRSWREAGLPPAYVSVNISAQQFRDANLADTIFAVVRDAGMEPETFVLEITESVLMDNLADGERILNEFKGHGFRIAIDDFGTGYSSLSYLKRFPIDIIKIDRSFIHDIDTQERDATVAAAVVALAHGLGLEPVAEGVENMEQRDVLLACGCPLMQGFLFAKPMPADEVVRLLAEHGGTLGWDAAGPSSDLAA